MLTNLEEFNIIFSLFLVFLNDWILPFIKAWWWAAPPFLLWNKFTFLWLWWRQELFWKGTDHILLEIRMPRETIKPIKAMEDVFSALTVIDNSAGNFREKWIEGGNSFYPAISFEMTSIGGETHFFIWLEKAYRSWVESAIYAQYPDAEITETEDYTKRVPQDIPNKNWDLEARVFKLKKEDCYPIKTYQSFETGTEAKEEKRVDPLAGLLEGFSALKEGEQLWVQMVAIKEISDDWIKEGEKTRNKLASRPEEKPKAQKPMIQKAIGLLIKGPQEEKEEKKEEKLIYTEMMMTPGEREVVKEIERKISKPGFHMAIRVVYLGKKESLFKPHLVLGISFLNRYAAADLNSFGGVAGTSTKVKSVFWFLDKRRAFLKKRKVFRNYVKRVTPLFPYPGGTSVFNTEEMASIFHFPGRILAPAPLVSRIEAKKGEAPHGLPTG